MLRPLLYSNWLVCIIILWNIDFNLGLLLYWDVMYKYENWFFFLNYWVFADSYHFVIYTPELNFLYQWLTVYYK